MTQGKAFRDRIGKFVLTNRSRIQVIFLFADAPAGLIHALPLSAVTDELTLHFLSNLI